MTETVLICLLLPFAGTAIGAGCVYFMKNGVSGRLKAPLCGFAAGVMTAASLFSLLIPALGYSGGSGFAAFAPVGAGFVCGMGLFFLIDFLLTRAEKGFFGSEAPEGAKSVGLLAIAVTLHNFPEGLAVGAALSAYIEGAGMTAAAVTALAVGIAAQNFPEGAIISLPLRAQGKSKSKAFACGALSGAVEPVGAAITLAAARFVGPALPFLLSFAAGAMIYVVAEELIPAFVEGEPPHPGTAAFTAGFAVMMSLDVLLG